MQSTREDSGFLSVREEPDGEAGGSVLVAVCQLPSDKNQVILA